MSVKVQDSLLITVPDNKIEKHLKLEKGSMVFITGGSHAGEIAKLKEFHLFEGPQADRVVLIHKKSEFETLKKYCFVIGKNEPLIKIR